MKNFFAIIIGAVIIGGCIYFGLRNSVVVTAPKSATPISAQNSTPIVKTDSTASTATCGAAENTIVTKVIDGDTVVVEGGYHVRLLGMDADEKDYPCYNAAKTRLEELVLSKKIKLETNIKNMINYLLIKRIKKNY